MLPLCTFHVNFVAEKGLWLPINTVWYTDSKSPLIANFNVMLQKAERSGRKIFLVSVSFNWIRFFEASTNFLFISNFD